MTKNDDLQQNKGSDIGTEEALRKSASKSLKSIKSTKSLRSPTDKRQDQPRRRRVKFAQPIIHLRLYDRTASPNAETEPVKNPRVHPTALDQLSPPLSLVAHLDMAAKRLNARSLNSQPHQTHRNATPSPQTQTTASTPTAPLTAPASKTQFPHRENRNHQVDKTGLSIDISSKSAAKTIKKPENDPKKDNKRTKN